MSTGSFSSSNVRNRKPRRSASPPLPEYLPFRDDIDQRVDKSWKDSDDEDEAEDGVHNSRAMRNLRTWESTVNEELALGKDAVPVGVGQRFWKEHVRDWRRAVDRKLYDKQIRKHKIVTELRDDEIKSQWQRSKAAAAVQEPRPPPAAAEKAANAKIVDRKRKVIRMENRVRDAEKDVEAVLRKRRMEEEKLVRDLYDAYLAEHRDALRHNSRLLKDELRAAQQKERQKREAEEHYRRDQLRMLEEELAGIKKEETIVVKAQAEEMRKVLREQKESARLNLMRVREKLRVDERDFDLKAIAAERIRGKLAFKPVPTGTTFGKNPKGRRR